MIEKLAEKHNNLVPNSELIKYMYVAIPIYKIQISITILKKKSIGILEEFLLKLIDLDIRKSNELSNILGIEESLVHTGVSNLFKSDLILFLFGEARITNKGKIALEDSKLILPQKVNFTLLFDALTGEFSADRGTFSSSEIKEKQFHAFRPYKSAPFLEELNFNDIARLIKKQKKEYLDDSLDGDLISIDKIEKNYISYKKRNLLIYADKYNKFDIKVFDGFDREVEYENVILKMQEDGINQLPLDRKALLEEIPESSLINLLTDDVKNEAKENQKLTQTLNLKSKALNEKILNYEEVMSVPENIPEEEFFSKTQEIKDLRIKLEEYESKMNSNTRYIETYEHRSLLINSLANAQKFVVILSPWIKFSGFDSELQKSILSALNRNVKILIGYGIGQQDDSDPRAIAKLSNLSKTSVGKKNLIFKKLGNTHEKVLFVDGLYTVITSFNWLSFRGNPEWGFRQESGIYTENKVLISQLKASISERMEVEIDNYL